MKTLTFVLTVATVAVALTSGGKVEAAQPHAGRQSGNHGGHQAGNHGGHNFGPHYHGHNFGGRRYNHAVYKHGWSGWSKRHFSRRHQAWVYWSDVEAVWYRLAPDNVYLPLEDESDVDGIESWTENPP
jgi:hypothetical protein